ncbi:hypothetical protein [Sphingomonas sp.]|uniref:hypothetical protein n=1 Tax=Sphingomonas sp. TaxID=28214 RepID=UPI00257A6B86|nr:hypothetical protein [Sphingomonas sp.]
MTAYTVQCGCAIYQACVVTVEADTLDAALERAIIAASDSDAWKLIDHVGPTFVDAVIEGRDLSPWRDWQSAIPVPHRFTETGRGAAPADPDPAAGDHPGGG